MTRCFVCNRIKEEQFNHWWALYLSITLPGGGTSLTLMPLAAAKGVEESSYKVACGNSCAQKLVERWLQSRAAGEGTLEPPHRPAGESV